MSFLVIESFRNKYEHYSDITRVALRVFENVSPYLIVNDRHVSGNKPELNSFNVKVIKCYDSAILRILQMMYLYLRFRNVDKVFLSTYPIFNLFAVILSFTQKSKSFVIVHGELAVLGSGVKTNRSKLNALLQRSMFRIAKIQSNFFICFLDSGILDSVRRNVGLAENPQLLSLEWPVIRDSITRNESTKDRITIGLFGTQSKVKNSHYVNFLAKNLPEEKIEFVVVGHNNGIYFDERIRTVGPKKSEYHVDQEIFLRELGHCDFILSLTDIKDYELIWSGTVVTALRYSIPLLSLPNRTFSNYSQYGNFGKEFEDINSLLYFLQSKSVADLKELSKEFITEIDSTDTTAQLNATKELFFKWL